MKLKVFLFIISLVMLAGTCDYTDNRLKIRNNSNHAIAFDYSIDTVLEQESKKIESIISDKIMPGETVSQTMPGSANGWPFLIKRSKNNKLNVFVFEVDTLLKYNDWEYIRTRKLYKRYEYLEEDLNRTNWTVEYP